MILLLAQLALADGPPPETPAEPEPRAESQLDDDLVLTPRAIGDEPWDGEGYCEVMALFGSPAVKVDGRSVFIEDASGEREQVASLGPDGSRFTRRRIRDFEWSETAFSFVAGRVRLPRHGRILGAGKALLGNELSGKQYRYRGKCSAHQVAGGVVAVWSEQQLL